MPDRSYGDHFCKSCYDEPITPPPPSPTNDCSNFSIGSGESSLYSSYYTASGWGKEDKKDHITDRMVQSMENSSDPEFYATYKRSYDSVEDDRVSTKKKSKPICSLDTKLNNNDETLMIQLVNICPTSTFLKIFLMKLQDMSDLNRKELKLLIKVFTRSQQAICNNLPPQMQILFKDRMVQANPEFQASRNSVKSSFAARPINEILCEEKKELEISSSDNLQTHSRNSDSFRNITPASSQYSGSVTANLLAPPSFQSQSSNFVPPPANFPSASNNFPPLNEFTSQTNNAPSDFISKSNNAISTYSSYASYDTSSPSSGIPGLTLIECDKPQNFSQYKWLAPNSNNRELSNFRRY